MNESDIDPLDGRMLAAMVGDDPARQRLWLERFLQRAEATLTEIRAAHQRGALAELGALGHRLKSPARSIGAVPLGGVCQALEEAGGRGEAARIDELLARLESRYAELVSYVEGVR